MNFKYLTYFLVTLGALTFTACGSGDADFSGTSGSTVSIVDCNSSTVVTDYTPLQSADVVVQDDNNTIVNTYHDIDGNKRICVDSGSAHIVR